MEEFGGEYDTRMCADGKVLKCRQTTVFHGHKVKVCVRCTHGRTHAEWEKDEISEFEHRSVDRRERLDEIRKW